MKTDKQRLCVAPLTAADEREAVRLACGLRLELVAVGVDSQHCDACEALLIVDGRTLALQLTGKGMPGPVTVDFGAGAMRHRRRSGHNELLGKAVGVGKRAGLTVIDATAGLGRDSFVLADLGCQVVMCERNPVVARLLASGLENARASADSWLSGVAFRMSLHEGASQGLVLDAAPDVIYLDPMFPHREKSAAVKKDMALFQFLLQGELADEASLIDWALSQDVARVVVKRPAKAPVLGDTPPSHSIQGKAVRYDVHVKRSVKRSVARALS